MTKEKDLDKDAKTSLSFPPELWREFRKLCIDRNITQREAVQEAVEAWMMPQPLHAAPVYSDDFIDVLMDILNNPRNETEKILRNLLKQVVDIRYSSLGQKRR